VLTLEWFDQFPSSRVAFERGIFCRDGNDTVSEWEEEAKSKLYDELNATRPGWNNTRKGWDRIQGILEQRKRDQLPIFGRQRAGCETPRMCICDPVLSRFCFEGAGASRTGLIHTGLKQYRDKHILGDSRVAGVDVHLIDARGALEEVLQDCSDQDFVQSAAARRMYLELVEDINFLDYRLATIRKYVGALTALPDFSNAVNHMMRQIENAVRKSYGVPAIGEGWVSETVLFHRIKGILSGEEVIQHGRPEWLGRQHLDIWIPAFSLAIEYQGTQHFQPIEFFGGEQAYNALRRRDARKRRLCRQNGVRLIEIAYDCPLTDDGLATLLRHKGR